MDVVDFSHEGIHQEVASGAIQLAFPAIHNFA